MRYYELFENQTEIKKALKEYFDIEGTPTINPDGTVNIAGDCFLKLAKKVNQLPVKFGEVSGNFDCYDNQLTSLIGAPQSVGSGFYYDWSPTLPLLRTVVAKEVRIYNNHNTFDEITDILNSCIRMNPGSYRGAALDAKRKLIDAGYKDNAKW
jgi:hypothetical protein